MYRTINSYEFERAFIEMDRQNHFSKDGLNALYDYLEEYVSTDDKGVELDVIGLCCTWTEYESFEDFQKEYSNDEIQTIEDLKNHTTVIMIPDCEYIKETPKGRFIISQF